MRNVIKFWTLTLIGLFGLSGTVIADNITKTFAFGEGTAYTRSNVRTFPVPCHLGVIATVKFARGGPAGADNDVPIKIDLIKPDIGADEEGPIAVTKSVTARRNEQTETLIGGLNNRGCSLPWRVRVQYANAGAAPVAVTGSITVDFDNNIKNISFGPFGIIRKGESADQKTEFTFSQGRVEITATWDHYVFVGPSFLNIGPLPVKLKFELIDPNGRVVATDTGHSNAEINPCCSGDKMKIVLQVSECQDFNPEYKWKLKITNNTNEDAKIKEIKATLKPNCS